MAYMYVLTPKGISVRLTQTYTFLQRKLNEFETLKQEIEALRRENGEFENFDKGDRQF